MIDYLDMLESRGFDCRPSGEYNVFISCPFHAEEAGSCSVNIKTGGFHCFGCDASGSFAKLLAEIEGIEIGSARLLLNDEVDVLGLLDGIESDLTREGAGVKRRYISAASFANKFPPLSGDFAEYMRGRGVSDDTCARFGLRCGVSGKWAGRVIMPLRNIAGKLVGFTGRAIYRDPFLKMRSHIAYPKAINEMLFGLYEVRAVIVATRTVILVEGPIDCMYLVSFGLPAVARLGKNLLSGPQVNLLVKYADRVLLMYDGDVNGLAALEKEYERLSGIIPTIPIRLTGDCDPNNLERAEVARIFRRYFKRRFVNV